MYEVLEESRQLVDPSRLCDVRYEELVKDPVGQVRQVYDQLGLEGFDDVLPALEQYAARTAGYKASRYDLPPETRDAVTRRWDAFIRKYGYAS
jgi:hypothetical protein